MTYGHLEPEHHMASNFGIVPDPADWAKSRSETEWQKLDR